MFVKNDIRKLLMRVFILFITLIIGSVASAYAEPLKFNHIIIDNVWIKDTPPNHKTTAGYLTIENLGDTDEILLSVSSSFAAKGEIHQMKMDGEVMKMRQVKTSINTQFLPKHIVQIKGVVPILQATPFLHLFFS